MELKDVIRTRREALGLTLEEIGKACGVGKSIVAKWERGEITNPRRSSIAALADVLMVSPLVIIGKEEPETAPPVPSGFDPLPPVEYVPRVGRIACGTPILAEENIEDTVAVPQKWHADFTLLCQGDSMAPRILDGDLVAIRKQPTVENGEIAAVRIGEEATLKHVYLYPDRMMLQADNPAYSPIMLVGAEMNTVTIEGKAVGLCRGI